MVLADIATTARPALDGEREEFRRLVYEGRFAEARRLAEGCCERGRDRVVWVRALAVAAYEQGNLREAYSLLLTHSPLLDCYKDHYSAANFHLSFGVVNKRLYQMHRSEDFFDRASIAYTAASFHFDKARAQKCVAYSENCLANLLVVAGRAGDAFEHIDRAQLLFNDAGEVARAADCEDTRALALEALGRDVDAYECASRAYVTLMRCGESEAKSIGQARETLERLYAKVSAR